MAMNMNNMMGGSNVQGDMSKNVINIYNSLFYIFFVYKLGKQYAS